MGTGLPCKVRMRCGRRREDAYPLLLHELAVGAVVDDILPEHGGGQDTVDILGVDILGLAVQDEFVAVGAYVYGGLLPKEDEGEDIAEL